MKLTAKMLLMFAVLILLAMSASLTGIVSLGLADRDSRHLAEEDVAFLSQYKNIYAQGLQRGQAVRNLLLNPNDAKAMDNFNNAVKDSEALFETLRSLSSEHGLDPAEIEALNVLSKKDVELQRKAVGLALTDSKGALKVIVEEETPVWREMKDRYFATEQKVDELFAASAAELKEGIRTSTEILYGIVVLFLVCSGGILWYMNRSITRPVLQASRQVGEIAKGNLAVALLPAVRKDELGGLARSLNEMVAQLQGLVGGIKLTSEQLASSSEALSVISDETTRAGRQVTSSIEQLAGGTETQLYGVQEATRAMEELATAVQRIAESSAEAAERASATAREAQTGQQALHGADAQMEAIRDSVGRTAEEIGSLRLRSEEIGEIIGVIKEISGQTQLLALNASIEAARAGDAGRGFAVVAGEVKKLALQSEASAGKIEALVSGLQQATGRAVQAMERGKAEVEKGRSVMNEAGEALHSILTETGEVAGQIQEISAAAEQMSAGTEQISASMEEMSRISGDSAAESQNAAAAAEEQLASMEEIADSARALKESAGRLRSMTEAFQGEARD
ncbi:methyl-accepting chemotaxis protein [Paenibacillus aurantius]|uniref:Methyl-accepting chemotaxis protein n=1 Tax=Paenibacillus aurantius TaxID=2918900 RepID=A0AA96LGB9_9BACL|nr:methyl-accepting chemotaxis protein [Paenibacillus aurantius]WNQ12773.1 methyl-accepting chemotaxis protein [Paenibacillus aurantius]